MLSLDEYNQHVKNYERIRRLTDQAQGAYDQFVENLKQETGCENEEEARKRLEKLDKKIEAKLPLVQKAEEDFNKKWSGNIQGD
jgi:hypothetical protein